jgi:hypothetical protein
VVSTGKHPLRLPICSATIQQRTHLLTLAQFNSPRNPLTYCIRVPPASTLRVTAIFRANVNVNVGSKLAFCAKPPPSPPTAAASNDRQCNDGRFGTCICSDPAISRPQPRRLLQAAAYAFVLRWLAALKYATTVHIPILFWPFTCPSKPGKCWWTYGTRISRQWPWFHAATSLSTTSVLPTARVFPIPTAWTCAFQRW